MPLSEAQRAIVRELNAERRVDAYGAWSIVQQKRAASRLVCERDRMPELGVVTLSTFAPFLSLHETTARGTPRDRAGRLRGRYERRSRRGSAARR